MRRHRLVPASTLALLALAGIASCQGGDDASPCADPIIDVANPVFDGGSAPAFKLLLYTFSTGYRHASIPDGIAAIRALGAANGFGVDVKGTARDLRGFYCGNQPEPADRTYFRSEALASYAAVVFLQTTTLTTPDSVLLDDAGKAALEAYVRAGGGFVGIHAVADAEYGWPFFHTLVGATFRDHGPPVTASLRIDDPTHPATAALPDPWLRFDEWYNFTANPRDTATVLITLDETSYPGNPNPMGDHPIAWWKAIDAGRSFYTGLGHGADAFRDPLLLRHLLGGIRFAAGALAANGTAR